MDEKGNQSFQTLDKEEFVTMHRNDMTPVVKFESPEAMSIVKQAIQEKYHLAETEMNEFFCDAIPIGLGEEDGMLYRMQFHTHYQMSQEMKYGAVINLGTGKVEAVYSYNPEQDRLLFCSAYRKRCISL